MKVSLLSLQDLSTKLSDHYPYSAQRIFDEASKLKHDYEDIEDLQTVLAKKLDQMVISGY